MTYKIRSPGELAVGQPTAILHQLAGGLGVWLRACCATCDALSIDTFGLIGCPVCDFLFCGPCLHLHFDGNEICTFEAREHAILESATFWGGLQTPAR